MPTEKQLLGKKGEEFVVKNCSCFKCKRKRTLKRLPPNFKCADIICDFCGYLAQVKTTTSRDIDLPPKRLPSAAWSVQLERMKAGIYFPLFIVQVKQRRKSIFLSARRFSVKTHVYCSKASVSYNKEGWMAGILL